GIRDGHVTGVQTCALPIFLVKSNRYVYSSSRIRTIVEQNLPLSTKLVRLFRLRFDPDFSDSSDDLELSRIAVELKQEIAAQVARSEERRVGKEGMSQSGGV